MFTTIDKNLLIAAMESAIYHACVAANIVSLHAIETGVSSLRQRFDVDPTSVTDAEVFGMVDTIERATIPSLTQIAELDNSVDIADRVVSFRWKNILEKPATFPSEWSLVQKKPSLANANHTHTAYALTTHGHADLAAADHAHTAYALTTHGHAGLAAVDHAHAEYALTTHGHADMAAVEHTHAEYALSTHTHPEYAGGGAATGGQWTLRLNGSPLSYTQLPPTLWTGQRLIVKVIGTLLMAEDAWMLRIDEDGGLLAGILASPSGNITAYTGLGGSVGVSMLGTAITAILDITPTHMTLTVNGISASIETSRTYTESLLTIQMQQLLDISTVGVWTGDPATTVPLILADAEHIDNNVMINQAARHIGAGQYDLTLNAPVVLYQ